MEELSDVMGKDSETFVVKSWTERGDGGIYRNGEKLSIFFYSNRNCYLKIYHIDVNGNTQLIFPNPFHRDNFIREKAIYQIPDERYPFTFELGPPFGAEFIKVIASTVQFPDIEEAFSEMGRASEKLVTRGLGVKRSDEQRTEALLSYTIIQ